MKAFLLLAIFVFLLISNILVVIECDCGLPALPFNAFINNVKQVYFESETVEYHCQLDELKLVGNKVRTCLSSKWHGTLPKCGKLRFITIKYTIKSN
jgi:hypothetical protein